MSTGAKLIKQKKNRKTGSVQESAISAAYVEGLIWTARNLLSGIAQNVQAEKSIAVIIYSVTYIYKNREKRSWRQDRFKETERSL